MNSIEKRQFDIITEMLKKQLTGGNGDFSIVFTGQVYPEVTKALTEKGHMVEKIDCEELLIRNGGKPSFLITPGEVVDEEKVETPSTENEGGNDKQPAHKYDEAGEMDERICCLVDEEDQNAPSVFQYLKKAAKKGKDTAEKGKETVEKVKTATGYVGAVFGWIGRTLCKIYAVGGYPAAEPDAAAAEPDEESEEAAAEEVVQGE